jgi:TolB-like protein/Tfp pilus assembly protein PilF
VSLFAELKRRNVFKVAAAYAVVAWITVQVMSIALPAFEAPVWVLRVLILLLALGLPLAIVLSWLFEVTPEGMKVEPAAFGNKRLFAVAAGLAALAIGWYFVGQPAVRPQAVDTADAAPATAATTVPAAPQRSIAVLPFVDMSQAKDQEYFSDGITEEILNELTHIEGLKVAGRTSSFHFKGRNDNLREIGAALGVAHVLEGSVRKQGDRIRITAQLIKVEDGFHVWSQDYDRKLDDIFAVQDEISAAIAAALSSRLAPATGATTSIDPQTYDTYLRARQVLAKRTGESIVEATRLFTQVTERQPTFDAAWSGRAKSLGLTFNYAGGNANDYIEPARESAKHALTLNPDNAEALMVLAFTDALYKWRWDDGVREINAAIALAPNDAEIANFAGDTFRFAGDLENAERWERRAVELDPLFMVNHSDLAWLLLMRRRPQEALVASERALRLDPAYSSVRDVRARIFLMLGDPARAAAEIDALAKADPRNSLVDELGARQAIAAGDLPKARKYLANLQRRAEAGETQDYSIAVVQAQLGELDAAGETLERAYAARDPFFPADTEFTLPSDWPDDPAIRAVFARPALAALVAARQRSRVTTPAAGSSR